MVGTSGSSGDALGASRRRARAACRALICGTPVAVSVIIMSIWPPSRSVIASGLLLYGTCRMSVSASCLNISPATRLDELPLPKLSLPGLFFAPRRAGRRRVLYGESALHHQHLAALAEAGDRREVLHRVVGQLLVQVLVGGVRGVGGDQHRVAVGRGACAAACAAMHAAGAGLVVDHHRLLGLLGDRLAERARELVGGAAGGERHDEGDRLVGIACACAHAPAREASSGEASAQAVAAGQWSMSSGVSVGW